MSEPLWVSLCSLPPTFFVFWLIWSLSFYSARYIHALCSGLPRWVPVKELALASPSSLWVDLEVCRGLELWGPLL